LAAQILFKLDELVGFGQPISKRRIERAMNANKLPLWPAAWRLLIREGCVRIAAAKSRQQNVSLVRMPEHLRARTISGAPASAAADRVVPGTAAGIPPTDGYRDRAAEVEEENGEVYGLLQYVPGDPLAR
jgi:hypothetical protein